MRAKHTWLVREIFIGDTSIMTALWPNWKLLRQTLPNDAGYFELRVTSSGARARRKSQCETWSAPLISTRATLSRSSRLRSVIDYLRRFAEEKSVLDRALAIEPNDVDTKVARAFVEFHWKADTRPLHQMIDSIRATNPAALQSIADAWLICALAERDAAAAKNALIAVGEIRP